MILFNALFFPFKDGGWFGKTVKNALSMLLIAPPFGYMVRIAQVVSDGNEKLPQTQVGGDFGRGVQILIAFLIYSIPAILISRVLQPPQPIMNFSNFNVSASVTSSIVQSLIAFLIALPFTLALLVGFIRFIITDSFLEFFNIPKNWEYLSAHFPIILSYYIQAYIATFIVYAVAAILIITICLPFLAYSWIFLVWGYTIGALARQLNLTWKGGKSQVTFE
jgi:Protein of unknown function (DUF4013)